MSSDRRFERKVEECIPVTIALIQTYLEGVNLSTNESDRRKKPRLRQTVQQWGIDSFLDHVSFHLSFPLFYHFPISEYSRRHQSYRHLGIHFQQQEGLSYMGLVVPLGRLISKQIKQLANLAEVYGDRTLRLTPWQNLLIPNIPNSKEDIPSLIEQILQTNYKIANSQYLTSDRNDT